MARRARLPVVAAPATENPGRVGAAAGSRGGLWHPKQMGRPSVVKSAGVGRRAVRGCEPGCGREHCCKRGSDGWTAAAEAGRWPSKEASTESRVW